MRCFLELRWKGIFLTWAIIYAWLVSSDMLSACNSGHTCADIRSDDLFVTEAKPQLECILAAQPVRDVVASLQAWKADANSTCRSSEAIYLLDHRYSADALKHKMLKGRDIELATTLEQACQGQPFEVFLASIEKSVVRTEDELIDTRFCYKQIFDLDGESVTKNVGTRGMVDVLQADKLQSRVNNDESVSSADGDYDGEKYHTYEEMVSCENHNVVKHHSLVCSASWWCRKNTSPRYSHGKWRPLVSWLPRLKDIHQSSSTSWSALWHIRITSLTLLPCSHLSRLHCPYWKKVFPQKGS